MTTATAPQFNDLARDRDNTYGARSWTGDYQLILAYSTELSGAQITTLEGEINAYYSLY